MKPRIKKPEVERFLLYVDKSGGPDACWLWTASTFHDGYGAFRRTRINGVSGKCAKAHRYAYELERGTIPSNRRLHHNCGNRSCCNPAHMVLHSMTEWREMYGEKLRASLPPPRRKLTPEQVVECRRLYAENRRTQAALAKRYKVKIAAVADILHRRSYKDVP